MKKESMNQPYFRFDICRFAVWMSLFVLPSWSCSKQSLTGNYATAPNAAPGESLNPIGSSGNSLNVISTIVTSPSLGPSNASSVVDFEPFDSPYVSGATINYTQATAMPFDSENDPGLSNMWATPGNATTSYLCGPVAAAMALQGALNRASVSTVSNQLVANSWTSTYFNNLQAQNGVSAADWQVANVAVKMTNTPIVAGVNAIASAASVINLEGGSYISSSYSGELVNGQFQQGSIQASTGQPTAATYSINVSDVSKVIPGSSQDLQANVDSGLKGDYSYMIPLSALSLTGSPGSAVGLLMDSTNPTSASNAYALVVQYGYYYPTLSSSGNTDTVVFHRNGGHFVVLSGYLQGSGNTYFTIHNPWSLDQNNKYFTPSVEYWQIKNFAPYTTSNGTQISFQNAWSSQLTNEYFESKDNSNLSVEQNSAYSSVGFGYFSTISSQDVSNGVVPTVSANPTPSEYYAIIEGYARIPAPLH
jgi:hypothetical protein